MGIAYLAIIRCVFHIKYGYKKNRDLWFSDFPKKLMVAVASLNQPVTYPSLANISGMFSRVVFIHDIPRAFAQSVHLFKYTVFATLHPATYTRRELIQLIYSHLSWRSWSLPCDDCYPKLSQSDYDTKETKDSTQEQTNYSNGERVPFGCMSFKP